MTIARTALGLVAAAALAGCGGFEPRLPDPRVVEASEKTFGHFELYRGEGNLAWVARNTVPEEERAATIRKAIDNFEKAWSIDPTAPDVLEKLAIAHFYLAHFFAEDPKEKEEIYSKGYGYAERAVLLNPEIARAVEGEKQPIEQAIAAHLRIHEVPRAFWFAVLWGRLVEDKNVAVRAGAAPRLKTIMETVYRLGPRYHFGGVHRFFGVYYTKAPGQSDPAGQSRREFERAIEVAPFYLENKVLMAEYYAVFVQDQELYERLLNEVLAAPEDAGPQFLRLDNSEAKKRARRLLAEVDERF